MKQCFIFRFFFFMQIPFETNSNRARTVFGISVVVEITREGSMLKMNDEGLAVTGLDVS